MKFKLNGKSALAAVFALFLFLTVFLHWAAGTFVSECGRYGDEGMHYVTSLFLKDFLLSGTWSKPMAFAQDYYLHFPKVGLGNWPPFFPMVNAAWMLVMGDSRIGLMTLSAIWTAIMAFLAWRDVRDEGIVALVACAALIASPTSQYLTSMVMAEILLTILTWLAFRCLLWYLDSGRPLMAVAFGIFAMLAIMTKGNAWVLALAAPLTILLTGNWRRLLDKWLWLGIGIIAVVCVPYTLWSMKMVVHGWDSTSAPGAERLLLSAKLHLQYMVWIIGWPLFLIVLAGIREKVFRPLFAGRKPESFWTGMLVLGITVMGFHIAIPTSIEPRKIYQITPVLGVFLAAGLGFLARRLASVIPGWPAPALSVATLGALVFLGTTFGIQESWRPGFGPAIEKILSLGDTERAAVLVSSNPFMLDQEAGIIASWAEVDRAKGNYLVRASKQLLGVRVDVPRFELPARFHTADEIQSALLAVPVSYAIVHHTPSQRDYLYVKLLDDMLAAHPESWRPFYSSTRQIEGKPHELRVFRSVAPWQGKPVKINIDLTQRIGEKLATPGGETK